MTRARLFLLGSNVRLGCLGARSGNCRRGRCWELLPSGGDSRRWSNQLLLLQTLQLGHQSSICLPIFGFYMFYFLFQEWFWNSNSISVCIEDCSGIGQFILSTQLYIKLPEFRHPHNNPFPFHNPWSTWDYFLFKICLGKPTIYIYHGHLIF